MGLERTCTRYFKWTDDLIPHWKPVWHLHLSPKHINFFSNLNSGMKPSLSAWLPAQLLPVPPWDCWFPFKQGSSRSRTLDTWGTLILPVLGPPTLSWTHPRESHCWPRLRDPFSTLVATPLKAPYGSAWSHFFLTSHLHRDPTCVLLPL